MRLIDANAEKAKVDVIVNSLIFGDEDADMLEFMDTLKQLLRNSFDAAPTIDAEPVRHGYWIPNNGKDGQCGYRCSVCRIPTKSYISCHFKRFGHCPLCGAKMDAQPPKETEDKHTNDFIDKRFNTVY